MVCTPRELANAKRYRERHPKRSNAAWQRYFWSEKGRVTALLNGAADRAKKSGLAYDLTREWLLEQLNKKVCSVSGIPFVVSGVRGRFKCHPFGPSIDKIDPRLGYTKDNCRLVVFCVNMARSDWGDAVLLEMAEGIVKNLHAE